MSKQLFRTCFSGDALWNKFVSALANNLISHHMPYAAAEKQTNKAYISTGESPGVYGHSNNINLVLLVDPERHMFLLADVRNHKRDLKKPEIEELALIIRKEFSDSSSLLGFGPSYLINPLNSQIHGMYTSAADHNSPNKWYIGESMAQHSHELLEFNSSITGKFFSAYWIFMLWYWPHSY